MFKFILSSPSLYDYKWYMYMLSQYLFPRILAQSL